jgi:protein gp37
MRIRYGKKSEISWHPETLSKIIKRKKPTTIFMGSAIDLFANVPLFGQYRAQIIETTRKAPHHTFLFLTKNPGEIWLTHFPQNCFVGTTITSAQFQDNAHKIRGAESPRKTRKTFISFEPLLDRLTPYGDGGFFPWPPNLKQIIIGAQSGPGAVYPERAWWTAIIWQAKKLKVPVFVKDNLIKHYPSLAKYRQLAWPVNK